MRAIGTGWARRACCRCAPPRPPRPARPEQKTSLLFRDAKSDELLLSNRDRSRTTPSGTSARPSAPRSGRRSCQVGPGPRLAPLWSTGLAQKPRVPAGGPADAVEVLPIAPTEYHIPTQFDDLLASSSFAASSRRMTSSNKGLHSHYTSNRWMHGASAGMPIARRPAPPSFLRRMLLDRHEEQVAVRAPAADTGCRDAW